MINAAVAVAVAVVVVAVVVVAVVIVIVPLYATICLCTVLQLSNDGKLITIKKFFMCHKFGRIHLAFISRQHAHEAGFFSLEKHIQEF